jgi:site-specific DNA recombinase
LTPNGRLEKRTWRGHKKSLSDIYSAHQISHQQPGPVDARIRLVTDHLVDRLLHPERLGLLLQSLKALRAEKAQNVNKRIIGLQREVTDSEDRLKRLYRLVENGLTDLDDVLKARLDKLKSDRDRP